VRGRDGRLGDPGATVSATREQRGTRSGRVPFDVGRSVYGTVLVMTVLAVDTTQGAPDYRDAIVTVLGAMVATFLAHLFADALAAFARDGGGSGAARGIRTIVGAARLDLVFLVLAVVAVAVLVIGVLGVWEPETAIRIIMIAGVAFLVLVGGLGGRRAGFGPWGVVACAAAAGVLGGVLLVVQVLLDH
jgi:hypothetical protein